MGRARKYTEIDNDTLYRHSADYVARKYGIAVRTVYQIRDSRRRYGFVDGIALDLQFMTEAEFDKKYDMTKRAMIRLRESNGQS
jgi:hypothetical protein